MKNLSTPNLFTVSSDRCEDMGDFHEHKTGNCVSPQSPRSRSARPSLCEAKTTLANDEREGDETFDSFPPFLTFAQGESWLEIEHAKASDELAESRFNYLV